MVSAFDSGAGGLGASSGWGHCVVFTLTVPLSTQVYKWVPKNLMLGVTLRWTSIPGRVEILPVASSYRNWDKLLPDGRSSI